MHRHIVEGEFLSARNVDSIQSWVKECDPNSMHGDCALDTFIPSRLVEVTQGGRSARLIITSNDRRFSLSRHACHDTKHLALSYCWGTPNPSKSRLSLERDTLHHMTSKIDPGALGLTIQDALIATFTLGYRYIWIDSL
jgi:hypothetical protein